ncbi:MAG: S-adenosylmethionine:tRNA ribosyltransferase-isomerase, partial [Microcystis sp. M53600_WE12]|nr:S-adenosylmethionine:tRNA ribosyltransferase-isomerase [Microcystis sp. M53600_WE12]
VGVGTFRPVEVENITEHLMHQEFLQISAETAEKIAQTKARGGRVIAVGTTVARALEGAIKETKSDKLTAFQGKTNLFVYPGYQWRVIDGMITNFHLPKSSLMMLVSALVGRERLLALYQAAIQERFRFYSFGDAMLILPSACSSNR